MHTIYRDLSASIVLGLLVPGILISAAVNLVPESRRQPEGSIDTSHICVRLSEEESVPMELNSYLTGVVLAEMPWDFAEEAMKAQAVAARTFAVKAAVTGGKHKDGSVCTDPVCCQSYIDPDEVPEQSSQTAAHAVNATSREVLTYHGELIEAVYSACSGGRTEDAVAVWQTDYPYLRSVPSPGEEEAYCFQQEHIFTRTVLEEKLEVNLSDDPKDWFQDIESTPGAGIQTVIIDGKQFQGTKLRALLGLPSTRIRVKALSDSVLLSTQGYGHRVGMSQFGANAMAEKGSTYTQILRYYYQGAEIEDGTPWIKNE